MLALVEEYFTAFVIGTVCLEVAAGPKHGKQSSQPMCWSIIDESVILYEHCGVVVNCVVSRVRIVLRVNTAHLFLL
jgi:hypothetical protein